MARSSCSLISAVLLVQVEYGKHQLARCGAPPWLFSAWAVGESPNCDRPSLRACLLVLVSHGQAAQHEADGGLDVDGGRNSCFLKPFKRINLIEMKAAMPDRRLKQACLVCNMASFPGMVVLD